MPTPRTILHLDMDAFFAAIEQLDQPALRGRPVLVGYDGPRGVVAAASYEARRFGCHSAQPMAVARRQCPRAIVVPVRGQRYREVSRQMFAILDTVSPLVEALSIDEAFIDMTGTEKLLGPAPAVAAQLKQRIRDELGLVASIGVAPNKLLAKLASDMDKPDGLTIIRPQDVEAVLAPLPVGRLWGVGPVTAARLEQAGIRTIAQLRAMPIDRLKRVAGDEAERFVRLAHGQDDRPVMPTRETKSISHEHTFDTDQHDIAQVQRMLFTQVEQVARRLRLAGLRTRSVSLKIRFGEFQTITRSITLDKSTSTTSDLWQAAKALFERWTSEAFQPVRLIGMTAGQLSRGEEQIALFPDETHLRQQRVDEAADRIAQRFGKGAIRRGGGMS